MRGVSNTLVEYYCEIKITLLFFWFILLLLLFSAQLTVEQMDWSEKRNKIYN